MHYKLIYCCFLFLVCYGQAQTLGGTTVYNFLSTSGSVQNTALGGENISQPSNDLSMAYHNPALLITTMQNQLSTSFNSMPGGISAGLISYSFKQNKLNTLLATSLYYVSYGSITQTDASGNILGNLKPLDFAAQISLSKNYSEKWNLGASLKLISSNYGLYQSIGFAIDAGVLYNDTTHGVSISLLVKNLGGQLTKYKHSTAGVLPLNLLLGISKKLKHAPLSFSLTATKLNNLIIGYNDPVFNANNNLPSNNSSKKFSLAQFLNHFTLSSKIFIGTKIEIDAGFHFLRNFELGKTFNNSGMAGFSLGAGLQWRTMQVRYARSSYIKNIALNQFGINILLNQL